MENRDKYLGGTDAAPLLGISKWCSPLQLWAIKTGQIVPEEVTSEAANLGKELEDYVARRFMRLTGKKVRRVNRTLFHPKYPFIGANLDREVEKEDAILECKTCSAWKAKEWEGQDIPLDYIAQVNHYLMVTGKTKGYIACLIGNQKFVWKEIIRDEKTMNDLLEKEVYFWKTFIEPKVMPMLISKIDNDTLYQLFPGQTDDAVALDDTALTIIESIQGLKADLMNIKDIISKQENELKAMLKENFLGVVNNYVVTWKEQVTKRVDTERLKEENTELYNQYVKESKFKVLRITKKEVENG